jgi:CBS domain-containing protein
MFDFDVRSGQDTPMPEILADISRAGTPRAGALREEFAEPVTKIPRRSPLVLAPSCGLREALKLMAHRHAAEAMVASHGVLLGMLSEREIVLRMLEADAPTADLPVWKVMSADPETLLDSDTIAYAVRKLWTLGGRAMPIVRSNGALAGLLETQDVVAWICERMGAAGDPRIGRTRKD